MDDLSRPPKLISKQKKINPFYISDFSNLANYTYPNGKVFEVSWDITELSLKQKLTQFNQYIDIFHIDMFFNFIKYI